MCAELDTASAAAERPGLAAAATTSPKGGPDYQPKLDRYDGPARKG